MPDVTLDPGEKDMSGGCAFIDGRFVPAGEARIPILDWGFLRSDATYDVAHVWRGAFFRLEDHLDRFQQGMDRLRMSLAMTRAEIREILIECVRRSGLREAYVEMVCTRGVPEPGSRDPRRARNRFYAFAIPFVWIADPGKQESGIHLVIGTTQRIAPEAVDPAVKNYHWLDLVKGQFEAYDRGGDTVVLTDDAGHVIEGPGFNVFAVLDGRIVTPSRGMLPGVTRRTVFEIAAQLSLPLEERPVTSDELRHAREAFATSTAGGVMPIARVDGRDLGDGKPGPLTRRIRQRYWAMHDDPAFATPVPYDAPA